MKYTTIKFGEVVDTWDLLRIDMRIEVKIDNNSDEKIYGKEDGSTNSEKAAMAAKITVTYKM